MTSLSSDTFLVADIPSQPAFAPLSGSGTGSNTLDILISAVTLTNGSPIISYGIEIDDGEGGNFVELTGITIYNLNLEVFANSGIQTGGLYRVRYRALNRIGWSDYSPIGYILAAQVPATPSPPTITINGINSIVSWTLPLNKGSEIVQAEITLLPGNIIDTVNCDGSSLTIFYERKCTIPVVNWGTTNGLT